MLVQLRVMREREPSSKALVFSQFASTIEWLKVKLQEQGFGYRTISGSMTLKQRSKVCMHSTAPHCCFTCIPVNVEAPILSPGPSMPPDAPYQTANPSPHSSWLCTGGCRKRSMRCKTQLSGVTLQVCKHANASLICIADHDCDA